MARRNSSSERLGARPGVLIETQPTKSRRAEEVAAPLNVPHREERVLREQLREMVRDINDLQAAIGEVAANGYSQLKVTQAADLKKSESELAGRVDRAKKKVQLRKDTITSLKERMQGAWISRWLFRSEFNALEKQLATEQDSLASDEQALLDVAQLEEDGASFLRDQRLVEEITKKFLSVLRGLQGELLSLFSEGRRMELEIIPLDQSFLAATETKMASIKREFVHLKEQLSLTSTFIPQAIISAADRRAARAAAEDHEHELTGTKRRSASAKKP